ncbi:MAG TPA: PilN domain-containing protein [Gaiellaceae bacterium]|nr:PilN domain-containing protein [Gaiellaceae bacterium]
MPHLRAILIGIAAIVAVLAGIVYMVRSTNTTIAAREQTVRDLEAQIAKVPKPGTPPAGEEQRLSVVRTVAGQRMSWDGFLSAVSKVLPEDVWLTDLRASGPSSATSSGVPAPSASPTGFTVTGYTYAQPSVARLMRRLGLVPWLSDVSLTTSAKQILNNHLVYEFTLGANVISLPEVGS